MSPAPTLRTRTRSYRVARWPGNDYSARCSVIYFIVPAGRATLPVAGGLDPVFVGVPLAHQILAYGAGNSRFGCSPRKVLAGWEGQAAQRREQPVRRSRLRAAAIHPDDVEFRGALECQSLRLVVDLGNNERPRAGRQLLEAAADSRQGGLVTDEQVPIQLGRNDKGASRPTHSQRLTLCRRCRPCGRRTCVMNDEIDEQATGMRVVAARRVIPHLRFYFINGGKHQLHVIVEPQRREAAQVVAPESDAYHFRCQSLDVFDAEPAKLRLMAHAANSRRVTHARISC